MKIEVIPVDRDRRRDRNGRQNLRKERENKSRKKRKEEASFESRVPRRQRGGIGNGVRTRRKRLTFHGRAVLSGDWDSRDRKIKPSEARTQIFRDGV